jgi:hypothetical protein
MSSPNNPVGNWPQFLPTAVKPSPQTPATTNPVANSRRPSYVEQLRQASSSQAAPYVTLLQETKTLEPSQPHDRPLREAPYSFARQRPS